MNKSKTTLRHTIIAMIGAVAILGPQVLNLLGEWQSPKAAAVSSLVGLIVALAVNGKGVAIVNLFLPGEEPQNGGFLRIYSGAPPATADTPFSENTLLAKIPMEGTAFKPSTGRKPDGGFLSDCALIRLGVLGLVVGVAFIVFAIWAKCSHAAESQFGGCFAGGAVCAGPSATITVGEYNVTRAKFSGGVSPGLGYGVTYAPDRWYATGASLNLAFSVGESSYAKPGLVLSFANYVRLGVAAYLYEGRREFAIVGGLGADFGGTPSFAGRGL